MSEFPIAGAYRPTIMGTHGMVASGHYLASLAGERILARGGNAIDAGVAAGLCLTVLQIDLIDLAGVAPMIIYLAEEDRVVRLLVDGSASLGFGSPSKLATARRMAAALAYLSLAGSERAQVFLARGAGHGSGLEAAGSPRRGRKAFAELCRELEAIRAEGATDLARAVEAVLMRSTRAGMLVVLSDFFDPNPLFSALGRARAAGHDVLLVQVLDPEELDPQLDGDYSLEDSETGARVEVTADPAALAAYAAKLAELVQNLRDWARRHGAVYIRTLTNGDLEPAVRRALSRSID